jgi:hypothetical protein
MQSCDKKVIPIHISSITEKYKYDSSNLLKSLLKYKLFFDNYRQHVYS